MSESGTVSGHHETRTIEDACIEIAVRVRYTEVVRPSGDEKQALFSAASPQVFLVRDGKELNITYHLDRDAYAEVLGLVAEEISPFSVPPSEIQAPPPPDPEPSVKAGTDARVDLDLNYTDDREDCSVLVSLTIDDKKRFSVRVSDWAIAKAWAQGGVSGISKLLAYELEQLVELARDTIFRDQSLTEEWRQKAYKNLNAAAQDYLLQGVESIREWIQRHE